jgi:predicted transcriptional regulator
MRLSTSVQTAFTESSGHNGTVVVAMMVVSGAPDRGIWPDHIWYSAGGAMPTCLSNQLSLLMLLAIRSEVTTRELALSLGITERAVHRILRDLAECGFITIGKRGYRNQYTVHPEKSAGHPAFPSLTVGELLAPVLTRTPITVAANGINHDAPMLVAVN